MNFKPFFFVLFISFLIVGCRSSRSGFSHSEVATDYLKENRNDSIDFKEKFAHYLSRQESNLRARIIEFYPLEPGDTAKHGSVKSITDLSLSSNHRSDSVVSEKHIVFKSDTTSSRFQETKHEETTYKVKRAPWYEPFLPYFILAILAVSLYYFRKK